MLTVPTEPSPTAHTSLGLPSVLVVGVPLEPGRHW
jgi:hypothetical protein